MSPVRETLDARGLIERFAAEIGASARVMHRPRIAEVHADADGQRFSAGVDWLFRQALLNFHRNGNGFHRIGKMQQEESPTVFSSKSLANWRIRA